MRILVGTTNPAKFDRYATMLRSLPDVEVVDPRVAQPVRPIIEDGATADENARKKARTYADATGLPALSVDDALYLPALPADQQPGIQVRRYLGRDATDEELLDAFLTKIGGLPPHQRWATWLYALCLALPRGQEFGAQVRIQASFTDRPYRPLLPGYPLSSLQVDPASGKPLRDLTPEEEAQRLRPVADAVGGIVRSALATSRAGEHG